MKTYTYEVRMINLKQEEVSIYGPTRSLGAARKVAQQQNPRRRINLYRDNKLLPGGRAGLDTHAYQLWWQQLEDALA